MTSKELIGYLDDMKITGKTASSSLEDVFVQMVRKKLAPVLEERAAELEEKRRAGGSRRGGRARSRRGG